MTLVRNVFWMTATTGLRLGSGVALTVVLARVMGVDNFGQLMSWFAVGALLAVPVNYGLGPMLLREAVHQADGGLVLYRDSLGLMLAISIVITAIALPVGSYFHAPVALMAAMMLTHFIESFIQLNSALLRAQDKYIEETKFATIQAGLQFCIVLLASMAYPDPLVVALGFLASRIASVSILTLITKKHLNSNLAPRFTRLSQSVRSGFHYFLDYGLFSTMQYIDVVLLKILAGPTAVGLYQAGMKVAGGINQLINIFVNATLPTLSKRLSGTKLSLAHVLQSVSLYGTLGFILTLPLLLFPEWISATLFGPNFQGLDNVMQILGIFVIVRFIGSGSGVVLVAIGDQQMRSVIMFIGLLALITASYVLMQDQGAEGAAKAVVIAYSVIAILLTALLLSRVGKITASVRHKEHDA